MEIKRATSKKGSVFRIIGTPTSVGTIYEVERLHKYGNFEAWNSANSFITADRNKIENEFNHIINSYY